MLSRVSSYWSHSRWTAGFHSPAPVYPRSRHGISIHLIAVILILLNVCTEILSQPPIIRLGLSVAHAGNVQYVYDDLGRLIAVVDVTSGEAAIYQYDAVGNLLGIVRQPVSTVSILNFTPKSGPVGTTVALSGTGYSPTASQNTVTFNGTPATVSSATATQLVVTVPTGATTGPIAVTTPTGSATSSTPFTVLTGGSGIGAPTITNFTPTIGLAGTSVTITGTNFDPTLGNTQVRFNASLTTGSSATPTTLTTPVPAAASSGRITVATQYGQAVSSGDFFIPPPPYTAADVEVTDRMAIGQSKGVTIATANKVAVIVFDGTVGQQVSITTTNVTLGSPTGYSVAWVSILNPFGQTIREDSIYQSGGFLETVPLSVSGTYTILVDPFSTRTGSLTVNLHNAADFLGSITPNGPAGAVSLPTPGQNARLTFTGIANQKVSLNMTNVTIGGGTGLTNATASILSPTGQVVGSVGVSGSAEFLAPVTLPANGTYTVVIDPYLSRTGNITLTLYMFVDVTGPITFGGPAVTANLTALGQRALWTFSGSANQKASIVINTSTVGSCSSGNLSVLKPDGTTLASTGSLCAGVIWGPLALPVSGTYTIVADPPDNTTGQVTVTLHEVIDVTGTVAFGQTVSATLSTPGQRALWTFSGGANQKASIVINTSTVGSCSNGDSSVLKPDGTILASTGSLCAGVIWGPVVLPTAGTYTIVADPYTTTTGQVTVTLHDVVDVTGTLTIGAAPTGVTITTPTQNASLTFTGTANQQVTVRVTGNTISSVTVKLLKPDGTTQTSSTSSAASFNLAQQTLATTGTYTVVVDPPGGNTGSLNVQVTSP